MSVVIEIPKTLQVRVLRIIVNQKSRTMHRDFPGGPVVKNLPSNAGDVGSISGQETKIPHAAEQLSLHAATTEPTCPNQRGRVPQ